MQKFVKLFIAPMLAGDRWRRVCEVGASLGGSTELLVSAPDVEVTVVDPCLDCNLAEKFAENSHVAVRKGISLEVLPKLAGTYDCILIDGDHNWYTVYHELKTIAERDLLRPGGIVFFHDIEWPWGRRDLYYQPDLIPPEYRHRFEQRGIVPGRRELSDDRGRFAGYHKASQEGGARNGVLTAIEDFLRDYKGKYRFFRVRVGNGLGMMQYRGGFRDDLTFLLLKCKGIACNVAIRAMRFKTNS